jgi:hypothetical protein
LCRGRPVVVPTAPGFGPENGLTLCVVFVILSELN